MNNVPQIADALQQVLTTTAIQAGRESGFIKREVKLNGATFVRTLVFTWMANPDASYDELAQTAAQMEVSITPQGLEQRFTREAAECVKQVLEAAVKKAFSAHPTALPLLDRFTEVYVQDSSVISLPDALRDLWPGCGGNAPSAAALKLQIRLAFRSGMLDGFFLTTGRSNDQGSPLQALPVKAGALRLADLGYWSIPHLAEIGAGGAFWLSRLQAGTHVYESGGPRLELPAFLAEQQVDEIERSIELGAKLHLPCRLLAQRVPPQVSEQRRRRLREDAVKKGFTPSRLQLTMCDWTLVVTNVPADKLSLAEALALLRVRWQIELLFKHWKSVGKIDESRSHKPERQLCEIYAKLLVQVIEHWCLLCGAWDYPRRSLTKAARLVRKHSLQLASALSHRNRLIEVLRALGRTLSIGCKINKRKKRPATFQQLEQLAWPLA